MARILIVDDSPTETYRFKEILERHGHVALEATNGADGVAVARAELPDLVLMDVVMPGINGFQATRQITKGADKLLKSPNFAISSAASAIVFGIS